MVKKLFLSLGLTSLVVSGLMACEPGGCTPGFWKNHAEAWTINPLRSYAVVFGVDATVVNEMVGDVNEKADNGDDILQLLEAVWMKGNDDKLKQLVRASVAALVNINTGLVYKNAGLVYKVEGYDGRMDEATLKEEVQKAFAGTIDAGELQRVLDNSNNEGCPF